MTLLLSYVVVMLRMLVTRYISVEAIVTECCRTYQHIVITHFIYELLVINKIVLKFLYYSCFKGYIIRPRHMQVFMHAYFA